METLLAYVAIDRKGEQPIHAQLRGAVETAIFSGELPDGVALPSVRQLARATGVAPNTVVRAYRELERDGWVRSTPKRAYYVTLSPPEENSGSAHSSQELDELIAQALDAAHRAGLGASDLAKLIVERARQGQQRRRVAVVGLTEAFLEERVSVVAEELADMDVEVIGISYQQLESDGHETGDLLESVDWFLAPVGEVQEASDLLGEHARRVLPMTRTMRSDVRDEIRSQPAWTCFGAIAGSQENIGRIVAALHKLHSLRVPPLTASIDNEEALESVIRNADVLVVGTRARAAMLQRDGFDKPVIYIAYVPDQRTIQRLRQRLLDNPRRPR